MRKYSGSCSPDEVHILQDICDVVMRELREHGRVSPSEDTELLRDVIARRVMSQFYGNGLMGDNGKTLSAVLKSFGVDHPMERASHA
jgi:hypothetical protein